MKRQITDSISENSTDSDLESDFSKRRFQLAYADAPQSIKELKEKIRAVINKIEPEMCENVMKNFMKRAWSCKRSRGGHINILFFIINGKSSAIE